MDEITDIVQREINNFRLFEQFKLDSISARNRLSALPKIVDENNNKFSIQYWDEIRKNCCVGYGLKCAREIMEIYKDNYTIKDQWLEAYNLAIENSECKSCLLQYLK